MLAGFQDPGLLCGVCGDALRQQCQRTGVQPYLRHAQAQEEHFPNLQPGRAFTLPAFPQCWAVMPCQKSRKGLPMAARNYHLLCTDFIVLEGSSPAACWAWMLRETPCRTGASHIWPAERCMLPTFPAVQLASTPEVLSAQRVAGRLAL